MGGGIIIRKNSYDSYSSLISIDNLFQAWDEFKCGKRKKKDVQIFERYLEDNIFKLHQKLTDQTYKHGCYSDFYVTDPKRRHIHKAKVEDRVIHHLLYNNLYTVFDKSFIFDSYSCRIGKGTHRGVLRLEHFLRKESKNYKHNCFVLKCDIKKYFTSIDHEILLKIILNRIRDKNLIWLIKEVVASFHSKFGFGKGIPLGNLTSQIFANIYLNQLDQFIKHELKVKYYLRYADDFVIVSSDKEWLESLVSKIDQFLKLNLKLELHPDKIKIGHFASGVDFLGYIILPYYKLPRTKTKKRIFKRLRRKIDEYKKTEISFESAHQSLYSYLGYLSHASSFRISQMLKNYFYLS